MLVFVGSNRLVASLVMVGLLFILIIITAVIAVSIKRNRVSKHKVHGYVSNVHGMKMY